MNALWFILNTALAVVISTGIGVALAGRRQTLTLALASLAAFPLVTVAAVLIAGSFGFLQNESVFLLLGSTLAAGWLIPRVRRAVTDIRDTGRIADNESGVPLGAGGIAIAAAVTAAFLLVPLLRSSLGGLNLGSDDLSYHAPGIAEWIINHRIVLSPYDYHAYYPFNAEAFAVWFALPFHGDSLVGIAGALWLALCWLATVHTVLTLGGTRLQALLAGALVVAAPYVTASAARLSSPDIAGVAMILSALALLSEPAARGEMPGTGRSLFAGLLLGFAAGCKVSYIFPLLVIGVWYLLLPSPAAPWNRRVRTVAFLAAGAVVTGTYWYLRNWWLTGNPLFPAQVGPFAGPFTAEVQARTTLATWIAERPTDLRQWVDIIRALADWPPALFIIAVAGYCAGFWTALRRNPAGHRHPFRTLLALIGLVPAVVFLFLPFSGTDNEPSGALDPKTRFLVLSFALGIVLFGTVPSRGERTPAVLAGGSLAALLTAWDASPWVGVLPVALVFLGFATSGIWTRIARSVQAHRSAVLASCLVGLLLALVVLEPFIRRQNASRLFSHGTETSPVGAGWEALESAPAGARIAWFTNKKQEYYPLFGRNLNRVPVPTDASGNPYRPLHTLFAENPAAISWWGVEAGPDSAMLLRNLNAHNIDYVFLSRWGGTSWPPQEAFLSAAGGTYTTVYDDGTSRILRRSSTPLPEDE